MFPHSDTVYAVHNLRLQDELQYASRQRLAATADDAAGTRPLHAALSDRLRRMGAGLRDAAAVLGRHPERCQVGQAETVGLGIQ